MNQPQKITIGAYTCWLLPDGEFDYPGETILPQEGAPPPQIPLPYTSLLVDTGPRRILIDTGAGSLGPKTGRLMNSLATAGVEPRDIDTVVISHAHPDHIALLPQFEKANVVMTRREFEFWTSSETQAKLEAGQLYRLGALERVTKNAVCEKLLPARERLRLVDEPAEPTGGVLVFAAPGHTPGHTAVLVSSNRQQLLYAGDAVIHPKQFEYPDWTSAFDLDANETGITRRNCWTGLWRIAAC